MNNNNNDRDVFGIKWKGHVALRKQTLIKSKADESELHRVFVSKANRASCTCALIFSFKNKKRHLRAVGWFWFMITKKKEDGEE